MKSGAINYKNSKITTTTTKTTSKRTINQTNESNRKLQLQEF